MIFQRLCFHWESFDSVGNCLRAINLPYDCSYSHASGLYTDDGKQGPFHSGGYKLRLDALESLLGIQLAIFVALLCVSDRSPKTAVTGTPLCYCVYFRVKPTILCQKEHEYVWFACFFDVVLTGAWTAMFCACQIIFVNTILAWPPPFYTAHAHLIFQIQCFDASNASRAPTPILIWQGSPHTELKAWQEGVVWVELATTWTLFELLPYSRQRNLPTEGMLGRRALCILWRTLYDLITLNIPDTITCMVIKMHCFDVDVCMDYLSLLWIAAHVTWISYPTFSINLIPVTVCNILSFVISKLKYKIQCCYVCIDSRDAAILRCTLPINFPSWLHVLLLRIYVATQNNTL